MTTAIMPTKGPYWVRPTMCFMSGHLTITSKERPIVATIPPKDEQGTANYADAALLASAPHLLEALIDIQLKLNSKEPCTVLEINQIISAAFEKIHVEADV